MRFLNKLELGEDMKLFLPVQFPSVLIQRDTVYQQMNLIWRMLICAQYQGKIDDFVIWPHTHTHTYIPTHTYTHAYDATRSPRNHHSRFYGEKTFVGCHLVLFTRDARINYIEDEIHVCVCEFWYVCVCVCENVWV